MLLGGVVIAGCQSDAYDPKANDATLSSYAAKQSFPNGVTPETDRGPGLFYDVAGNGVITIFNAGDGGFSNLNVWVNQQFVIHVDSLPAHSRIKIAPEKVYDSAAKNLTTIVPENVRKVEITTDGNTHVYDLAGPVKQT
jgi:hypothetical protein